ncbi:MAG: AMIN domain-containing protein [Legionellales bacterium]|nr:AMIN domain-containing protein [Legionellales bacterium]
MRTWQRRLLNALSALVFLLPFSIWAANDIVLKQARISNATTDHVQLTLNLTQTPQYKWFLLSNPTRLVIDLQQTTNNADFKHLPLTDTLIQKVRAGSQSDQTLRLVLELAKPASIKIHTASSASGTSEQLIIQLTSKIDTITTTSTPSPQNKKQSSLTTINTTVSPTVHKSSTISSNTTQPILSIPAKPISHKIVVVIDPGHGGKDPGASGTNGQHEKDLVLAISRDLYKALEKNSNMTVYMTRYGDYYIGLRQRLQMARRDKADIFIAIHADAYKDAYSTGASVFALSIRGASSEAARWLAEKENYSELGGVNLAGKNDVLRSVLIDLSQTASISSSLFLGSDLLTQIGMISPLHKTKVEQAPFVVLKSPDIPSVLVETGFISNPAEERALSNAAYQQKIANAIEKGIEMYFNQHPSI